MKSKPYLKLVLATLFAALTVLTVFWPMWIELLTGLEPDEGSGELERVIVAVFAALAVLALTMWQKDFKRARTTAAI